MHQNSSFKNDSTANSGLLTVLLLISEQPSISASPRGRSGEFTDAGEEEVASHTQPGSFLYLPQVMPVPADHAAFLLLFRRNTLPDFYSQICSFEYSVSLGIRPKQSGIGSHSRASPVAESEAAPRLIKQTLTD